MSDNSKFQFGPYVVVPARREVLLDGKERAIAPKAFDVLIYLIENRDRVVGRAELLREIWKGRVVVENAVSRTIMQTREAIGDAGENPRFIRTVQRAGYRFVGELHQFVDLDPVAASIKSPGITGSPGALRLGFLPFINRTGDAKLAWVELGLLSLVVQSLNKDSRLTIPSTASVLVCTENLSPLLTEAEKAAKLMELLGVKVVVSAKIAKRSDQFEISFCTFGREPDDCEGVLVGPELTQLALQLAQEVEQKIFPSNPRGISPQSDNNFVNECFSRGMEASAARHWQSASKYFSVACMMEPERIEARLEYAYVLARIPDPTAIAAAEALIRNAQALNDQVSEARATYVLALALAEAGLDRPAASEMVRRALALATPGIGAEWLIRAFLLKSYLALVQQDYQACADATQEAYQACEENKNRAALLTVLTNRGALESEVGDITSSYATANEVLALSENLGKPPFQAVSNCSFAEFVFGEFEKSLTSIDTFVDLCTAAKDRPFISVRLAVAGAFSRGCDLRETQRLVQWKEKLVPVLGIPENSFARALDLYRDAFIDQSSGDLESACQLLAKARELLDDGKHYRELSLVLPDLILTHLRLGNLEDASAMRRRLDAYNEVENDRSIRPVIFYLDALYAWVSGDHDFAFAHMEDALTIPFASRWESYLRIDLAWNYLSKGRVTRAESILEPVEPWIDRHPAGLTVGAMLAFKQGDLSLAVERHRRHLKLVGDTGKTQMHELDSFYDALNTKRHFAELPVLDRLLPSFYWVAK